MSTSAKRKAESIGEEQSLKMRKIAADDGLIDLENFRLPGLPGSDISYISDFVLSGVADEWYEKLAKLDTWYHPKLKVYGKEVTQSRSIATYCTDRTLVVKYSGHTVDLQYDYPPVLRSIQDMVEARLGQTFNHVMLNWYENGNEYIGRHRDNKENKVIASLSLGAVRTFILTPNSTLAKDDGKTKPSKFTLSNGSLLVMQGDTQKHWKHEIPKEPKVKTGRISLTFRQLEF